METTITYTEEVEKSEKMLLCDDCQRELDDDGTKYIPVTESHDTTNNRADGAVLHYCSECLPPEEKEKPEHVVRAEEWMDTDMGGYTVRDNLVLARRVSAVLCLFPVFAAVLISVGILGGAMFALLAITIGLLVVYWLFTEAELTNSPYY